MLNSSKYFRKHAQIRDSFVVKFSSHRLKILVEFKRAHYAGISEFHLSTETFGFSNKFLKKWLLCALFCSSVFIHNSRSENGRKTIASAPAVSANFSCNFDFHGWISPDRFRYETSLFLFKISVTCYSKGITAKFSHFYFTFISKIVT